MLSYKQQVALAISFLSMVGIMFLIELFLIVDLLMSVL